MKSKLRSRLRAASVDALMRVYFYIHDHASTDLVGMERFLENFPVSTLCEKASSVHGMVINITSAMPAVMRMHKVVGLVEDDEWALVECESSSEIGSIHECDEHEDGTSELHLRRRAT